PQNCSNGAVFDPNNPNCLGSELDPRSNQVMKLRNASIIITPGYKWLDRVWVGENDLGGFDPFVIGKIRYIDRFNMSAIHASGSPHQRELQWGLIRTSNRTFLEASNLAGRFNVGQVEPFDTAYAFQPKVKFNPQLDLHGLISYANDQQLPPTDAFNDNRR